jgi:peptidoglycan/xylan/chitin deacetylase (PgdA/CDA1 family)
MRSAFLFFAVMLWWSCGPQAAVESEVYAERESALQPNVALDGSDLADHVLSLTFDDGPGVNTLALAEYLYQEKIQATFFVIGNTAKGHENVLAKLRDLGHLVGNHTYTHAPIIQSADPVGEVLQTDAVIAPYVTSNMFLFRAPQGKWNANTAQRLQAAGLNRYVGHIHWTAGGNFSARTSMDWNCWGQNESVVECGRGYLNEINSVKRGVVLMHDVHERTFDLVRWMVPRLRARGFSFARLDASPAISSALRLVNGRPSTGLVSNTVRPPVKTILSLSPFDLAFYAYRGNLIDEGIPSALGFCDALANGAIDASVVADAAAYSGHLVPAEATSGAYLNALDLQIKSLCN